jgi:NADP-dependent aldehyde dehydrogenase
MVSVIVRHPFASGGSEFAESHDGPRAWRTTRRTYTKRRDVPFGQGVGVPCREESKAIAQTARERSIHFSTYTELKLAVTIDSSTVLASTMSGGKDPGRWRRGVSGACLSAGQFAQRAPRPDFDIRICVTASHDFAISEATAAATAAQDAIGNMGRSYRAAMLERIAADLDAAGDELIPLADEESSLGPVRLTGELARTTNQLRLFASVLRDGGYLEVTVDHADPDATPPQPDLRRLLVPIGPVGVFPASNFPFAFSVAGGDTASALAAGCPVLVKGHSAHLRLSRRTAEIVASSVESSGLPRGTFGHVEGREAGRQLVQDPAIKAVGFTGSLSAGRALFDLANGRRDPIPFYGELSSINPVVVGPEAARSRPDAIAEGLLESITMGVGQFCTKPGVVFVPASDDLTSQVASLLEGDRATARPMLNDRILDSYTQGLARLIETDVVEVVAGEVTSPGAAAATPIVFATSIEAMRGKFDVFTNECFGPTSVLVRYSSLEELEELLADLPGCLAACMQADAVEFDALGGVFSALRSLAGRVVLDGWPTGVAVTWAIHHGGPWPATTNALHTSVGASAIRRFLRPQSYQNVPGELLPAELRDENLHTIPRRVDGRLELAAT